MPTEPAANAETPEAESQAPTAVGGDGEPSLNFAARIAFQYLVVQPDEEVVPSELGRQIVQALERDPRVTRVTGPAVTDAYSYGHVILPARDSDEDDDEDLFTDPGHYHALQLSDAIMIWAHVPIKNQPTREGEQLPPPSEDYIALWDGLTLLVAWEHDPGSHAPLSAGEVLFDIIERAAKDADCVIYGQRCSAVCDFPFVHVDLDVRADPTEDAVRWLPQADPGSMELEVTVPTSPTEGLALGALTLWFECAQACASFARMKNSGRRVLDLEFATRSTLHRLNTLQLEGVRRAALPFFPRFRDRFRVRGWRREAREHVAELWIGLELLERVRRRWAQERFEFDKVAPPSSGLASVFVRDHEDDVARIETLDLSLVRASVEETAKRLDTRAIALATAGGALAGGLAGAALGALAGHI
jgi:hypothetical protein